jgi:hypothetical protein
LKFLTLSQYNLNSSTTRISSEALSQTFRDAIEVVRSLGLDYIWIDSLCIIQDKDSDDWTKESSKMSQVYGSSYLNLTATAGVDGSRGFAAKEFDLSCNFSFTARGKVGNEDRLFQCVPRSLYQDSISSAPLNIRGWVVQERILAPRTVHFSDTELFGECIERTACESFPERLYEDLGNFALSRFLDKETSSRVFVGINCGALLSL